MPAEIPRKTGTKTAFAMRGPSAPGPAYTAVVWTGSVDDKPSTDLVGSEAAGPLLFDVLEALANHEVAHLPAGAPDDLAEGRGLRVLRSRSDRGMRSPDQSTRPGARGADNADRPYHQTFEVDDAGLRRAARPARRRARPTTTRSFVVLRRAQCARGSRGAASGAFGRAELAPDAPSAPAMPQSQRRRSSRRSEGQVVTLVPGVTPGAQRVALTASTRAAHLSWFVDGALIETAPAGERVFWIPTAGKHPSWSCATMQGAKARRLVEIRAPRRRSPQRPRDRRYSRRWVRSSRALALTEVPTVDAKPRLRGADWRGEAPRFPGLSHHRQVIGEGGMGTVYAAEQEAPRRSVAIKVLQSRSGGALARFAAEAEIMARLDHPGIARVFEAGDADGHPFLVMEHVDGLTLDKFAPALSLRRRIELFASLCDAVHHAHLKGVIHRDLKPSNVMVKSDGRVIVLDFGVAHLADARRQDAAWPASNSVTRAGDLVGTPLYMSPEQALLHADEVDARTDVYTLGVILAASSRAATCRTGRATRRSAC